MSNKNKSDFLFALKHGCIIGLWALVIALFTGFVSQLIIKNIPYLTLSFSVLLAVILTGTVFDIIGIAAAAANEKPLNARAAKGEFGAQHAVALVKNAHSVASFCNDVIGDVCGTLAGAVGVTIVLTIMNGTANAITVAATTVMTAIIASVIVAGKAFGKPLAIDTGTTIIYRVGQVIAWFELWVPWTVYPTTRRRKRKLRHKIIRKNKKKSSG